MDTSNGESGAVDAFRRASRTVAETLSRQNIYQQQKLNILSLSYTLEYCTHIYKICVREREREETWGEPKKTTGFFFEEKHRVEWAEEDGGVEALKHKNRRNISDEEFIPHLIFTLSFAAEQQEITLFV